jgi:hypothetical protein
MAPCHHNSNNALLRVHFHGTNISLYNNLVHSNVADTMLKSMWIYRGPSAATGVLIISPITAQMHVRSPIKMGAMNVSWQYSGCTLSKD